MSSEKAIFRLQSSLKAHPWGSLSLLPLLLGEKNPEGTHWAELWMGTHPSGANLVQLDRKTALTLDKLIKPHAAALLGPMVGQRIKQLPFLLKVLGLGSPQPLQLHPTREQAKAGFNAENEAGVPINAGKRRFKDPYTKTKIVCALSDDFEILLGFRPYDAIINEFYLASFSLLHHELEALANQPDAEGLQQFIAALSQIKGPRLDKLLAEAQDYALACAEPHQRWVGQLIELFPNDITCLAPLYMNLVAVSAGQAVHIPTNTAHSCLQGMAVELADVSDNILPLGLTGTPLKTQDNWDLVNFEPTASELLEASEAGITFSTPTPHFSLSRIEITADNPHFINGKNPPQILLCAKGKARLICAAGNTTVADKTAIPMVRGEAFFIPFGAGGYSIEGRGEFFIATAL